EVAHAVGVDLALPHGPRDGPAAAHEGEDALAVAGLPVAVGLLAAGAGHELPLGLGGQAAAAGLAVRGRGEPGDVRHGGVGVGRAEPAVVAPVGEVAVRREHAWDGALGPLGMLPYEGEELGV